MQIRPAFCDVAQGRSLEGVLLLLRRWKLAAPSNIVAGCRADVLKRSVGERGPAMAARAMRLAIEQGKATLGFRRNRVLVSHDPAIERRLPCDNGALIGRKRQLDFSPRDVLVAKRAGECRCVSGHGP